MVANSYERRENRENLLFSSSLQHRRSHVELQLTEEDMRREYTVVVDMSMQDIDQGSDWAYDASLEEVGSSMMKDSQVVAIDDECYC